MTAPHPDPAHVEILARILHDAMWFDDRPDRWDRIPDEWKRHHRESAVRALTKIDTLAAQVAVIAGERA